MYACHMYRTAKANKEKLLKAATEQLSMRPTSDDGNPTEWLGNMPSSAVELSQAVSGTSNTMSKHEITLQVTPVGPIPSLS